MCQSVNLSWKIVVEKADCVFTNFCGGHKNNCGYNLVSPLKLEKRDYF